ncbi:hypothetical protein, conserved [Trypanosoma brucei gambiense DAL972]|uniref:PDZ domain-containing protein n=1 Tax=Trypanosoma brucei gambiense (strain MHOM/CI/86/DAL972) TaxID=679716 RepID=D0A0T7_TRYB9|nr:hypothetical protein, conserved [Trypanosoma brucei gambiense DAL972]CBH16845.1 hypothetical protein, conserved [Trypanosoma brucei gambiense DAL972]|eukprot:XP_011779109.1 hypothetical protein, conserved [Trypanosoma brucei gambiense DAL972]
MLWSTPPQSERVPQVSTTMEELASTSSTLEQLQSFFVLHTFDTSGPFSDLFSVLLSCCKHLVDSSVSQNTVICGQAREIERLAREVEELRGTLVSQRSYFQDLENRRLAHSVASAEEAQGINAEVVGRRLNKLDGAVHAVQKTVEEDRHPRTGGVNEERGMWERVNRLEVDLESLKERVSSTTENIRAEVATIGNAVSSIKTSSAPDYILASQSYTDAKIANVREEIFMAKQSKTSIADNSKLYTGTSPPQNWKSDTECVMNRSTRSLESGDPNEKCGRAGYRPCGTEVWENIPARLDELESRLEVLEVYAPHHSAMAARPPLLGVELRDERGGGVRVHEVFSGFAAHAAGVLPGDVVVALNARNVNTRAEMYALIAELTQENEVKRRLLMQMYYEEHSGSCRNEEAKEGCCFLQAPNSAAVSGRWFGSGSGTAGAGNVRTMNKAELTAGMARRWDLPKLQFALHLKRGGFLHEVVVICERASGS